MEKFDFVELIGSLKDLEDKGITISSKGTIVDLKNDYAIVIFFNEKNLGDYAVVNVETKFLNKIGEFPKEQINKLNDFIKNLDYNKNNKFFTPNIKEYDLVELLVEHEKYSKYNVHKGNKGCVISKYAINNKVEVDFTYIDKDGNFCGDVIVVSVKDLKVLE